jgi:cytochrome c oxidase subunit 4
MSHEEAAGSSHPPHPTAHVVTFRLLAIIWLSLVGLTVVTVAVAAVNLGRLNLVMALGIATVKASLVLLYFMHLRWDRPFNGVLFISMLLFAALFISFALMDSSAYRPELIPCYAPGIRTVPPRAQ